MAFATKWREILEAHPNVDFWQEMVTGLIVKNGVVKGVTTVMGLEIPARAVVLTNGTFLNGLIHIGEKQFGGGRAGEKAAKGITEQLVQLGFESGRMKTGTPPRVDGRSLDYSRMEVQPGDEHPGKFSFTNTPALTDQIPCHITYTSPEVHEILKTGFDRSPMFNGRIRGTGPRYCPSIEDKIDRFADKSAHQLFVEPEGRNTVEVYVNGFSSSLPEDVQFRALRRIPGFEACKMFRPGYAIEYDYFPPTQLALSLETLLVKNLFFAGQINGTTGYEEAGCQGLVAGINAHLAIHDREPFILQRSEAYIGVLIDDLIHKGTREPYRMFTSRAEFRILLRQDNSDLRLTPKAAELGIRGAEERMQMVEQKRSDTNVIERFFEETSIAPEEINGFLSSVDSQPIDQKQKLINILRRPEVSISALRGTVPVLDEFLSRYSQDPVELAETDIKYAGYIAKEQEMVEKMNRLEELVLHDSLDYRTIRALSSEAREKLTRMRPRTLGQASRISGVSPADISVLLVHVGR
jgi:tRNA uridine 5-carboxymethylaminomethyl modification enzyme